MTTTDALAPLRCDVYFGQAVLDRPKSNFRFTLDTVAKLDLISIAGHRYEFLGGLLSGSSFVGVAV